MIGADREGDVVERDPRFSETRERILEDMEREIEAAVMRARRRLAAIESLPAPSLGRNGESVPTREG